MTKDIEFIGAYYQIRQLPKDDRPEIVICGRSNVGKSSFINSLFNRKNLAKTSSIPGKTRSLNFYMVDGSFYFVDLPGFGYAKVSKTEREYWNKLIDEYFKSRKNIALAFHLIDSRHKPSELDLLLNSYLRNSSLAYIVLLNKVDKLKQTEVSTARRNIIEVFPELIWGENLYAYSSVKHVGQKEIREKLSVLFKK
ncbi:MAG: ribosome biogenesis GTP-binding protein YihA/YsxC [Bacillota bacterium]